MAAIAYGGTEAVADELMSPPFASRHFLMGVSSMASGINHASDSAQNGIDEWTRAADLVNLFFHVKWNALDGKALLEGHDWTLRLGDEAGKRGLKKSMVFDFTHDGQVHDDVLAGVGLVNAFPDQRPLPSGGLDNPDIRAAYKDELLALAKRVKPDYVFVGLEINIFYYRCPEMWPSFVAMYKDCYDAIKAELPATQVSVYTAGLPDSRETHALKMLLPKLDNLAYSIYCDTPWELPDGYLTRIRRIDPSLPLFIAEFGVRTYRGESDEASQERALYRYLEAFSSVETEAVVWCHLHDQDFTGGPPWFKDAFETIGLKRLDGTPKRAYNLWKAAFERPPVFRDLWRVLLDQQARDKGRR